MYINTRIAITEWYNTHKRALPWRETKSAYHIWLSEVILQQTRVQQGLSYYSKFLKTFPSVHDLAQANESEVLLLWQGLGYYSRARNMHSSAKMIVDNFQGSFPDNYHDILSLKGVGEYTAAAIASFAFDLPYVAVDGNVLRVISRIYGIEEDIMISSTRKHISAIAQEMLADSPPALFNQSMMEFGAIQCKTGQADCAICPVQDYCYAFKNNKVKELPLKINKTKVRNRYFNYLVFINNKNKLFIKQRKGSGIWQNLYEFPMIESKKSINKIELLKEIRKQKLCSSNIKLVFHSKEIKHKLSHQLLHIHFNILECDSILTNNDWLEVDLSTIDDYPFPVIINKNKSLIINKLPKHENH